MSPRRPAAPERLSPLAYSDFSVSLQLVLLAPALALLIGLSKVRPSDYFFFTVLVAFFLLAALISGSASYDEAQKQLAKTQQADHSLPARRPAGASQSRRFNNHWDGLLLPVIFAGVLLRFSYWQGAFRLNFFLLKLLSLATLYLLFIHALRWRGPLLWVCGYDAASDSCQLERGHWRGGPVQREQWPATDFVGLYVERASPLLGAFSIPPEQAGWLTAAPGVSLKQLAAALPPLHGRIWLAGKEGGEDVLLADLNSWYRRNYREAQRLAEKLSEASGLPVLHRWPAPPARISRWPLHLFYLGKKP